MNNKSQYSIRLANGQEKSFESAAEMAQWMAEQKEQNRPRPSGSAKSRRRKQKRKVRCYSGDSPLARYANRNSDET